MTAVENQQEKPRGFAEDTLGSGDEYALYFNQLCDVFTKLMSCYHVDMANCYEAQSIRIYLTKLLYSVQALRKKYIYNPAHSLKVDLTESGFPNFLEMSYLSVDLLNRENRLAALPPANMLKQSILDYMFKYNEEPKDLLWQLSEREYCEMLDEDKMFLAFTPGKFSLRAEKETMRSYVFSWGCYDFRTNRPYLHILTFDQDISAEPLHLKGSSRHQFLEVVKTEGSRVPDVGILALAIDDDLESIHPKVLKRICIGPLHGNRTCREPAALCNLLDTYAKSEEDFILLLKDEIVFSERQAEIVSGKKSPKKVREIFYIPETDLDCYQSKASMIHRYMLMPHAVLQHMETEGALKEYGQYRKLTVDQEGQVHGM